MDDYYTINKLQDDTAVFLNYWNFPEPFASAIRAHYGMTILTGRNAEISASSISGYNIGINSLLETKASEEGKVSNTEKLKACIRLTEYLTSKEMQKQLFIRGELVPAIPALYGDAEVCAVQDCDLYKNLQPIVNRIYEIHGGMYERTMMTNMTSICESNGNGNNGSGNITNGNIGSGNIGSGNIAYGYNGNSNGENIGNNKWNVNNSGKVSNNT